LIIGQYLLKFLFIWVCVCPSGNWFPLNKWSSYWANLLKLIHKSSWKTPKGF